jgi:hypothetical protein
MWPAGRMLSPTGLDECSFLKNGYLTVHFVDNLDIGFRNVLNICKAFFIFI